MRYEAKRLSYQKIHVFGAAVFFLSFNSSDELI